MTHKGNPVDILIIGGGMITHDQLLPSLYHLQRLGRVAKISICALNTRPLKELAESPTLQAAFPGQSFHSIPDYETEDPDRSCPDLYKEALASLPPDQVVVVAVPDPLHDRMIRAALADNQHVLCVKPLVQKCAQAFEIEQLAKSKGLFVGIEYHKRFDRRALIARKDYRAGKFGEFKIGEARMVEPWLYRYSNFQNWFTKENADPFTYVGCHYVDQVYFITGLRPVSVSVRGIEGAFPNGNAAYLWSLGIVTFENGGLLSLINGLGYPDEGAGPNDQGINLFCEGKNGGALIGHNDQFRGVVHSYTTNTGPGGTHYNYINPDYFQYVSWPGPGLKPVGYGYDSVEAILAAIEQVRSAGSTDTRRNVIDEIDRKGLIATPANSFINELVTEAARLSLTHGGKEYRIVYKPTPRVIE
jgi:predicted dehydrogenase